MNGIDDNFEPGGDAVRGVDTGARDRLKRVLNRAANVCLLACVLAVPVAFVYPRGWGPATTFTGFVLYLVLKQLRHEI